jgi:two-component system sensor histidine kinase TorS
MGGSLEVQSRQGLGSTFTLTVPFEAAPERAPRRTDRQIPTADRTLQILVVEDDDATQIVARGFLERMGHDVTVVGDGFAAVDAVRRQAPDLVVMDISLPGIDGIETARRLRLAVGAHLPILAVSAHVFRDEIDRYLASGMNGFIGKPLTPEALAAAISDVVTSGGHRGPNRIDHAMLQQDLAALGPATMARILGIAEQTLPQRFAEMRDALAAGDAELVARQAHAACSAAASAGLTEIYPQAAEIEAAARRGRLVEAAAILEACEVGFDGALSEARRLVDAMPS